jgi:glycosyltransferase involved in cell wall biosynthesis
MAAPLVSIVTVSYNQAEYLETCVASVLAQSYRNIEYIIIDGGSSDGSPEIIKSHANRLAYWHSRQDKGAADALNQGFERAKGSIFAFLNSDDVLKPSAVEKWVRALEEQPDASLSYGDIAIIDSKGNPSHLPGKWASTFRAGRWSLRSHAANAVTIPQQSTAWRREVHTTIGGFNIMNKTCWDGEFFAQAAMKGFLFQQIPEVLASFRVHGGSISGSGKLRQTYLVDTARIDREWVAHGLVISHTERVFRTFVTRLQRFLRQPSAVAPLHG